MRATEEIPDDHPIKKVTVSLAALAEEAARDRMDEGSDRADGAFPYLHLGLKRLSYRVPRIEGLLATGGTLMVCQLVDFLVRRAEQQ